MPILWVQRFGFAVFLGSWVAGNPVSAIALNPVPRFYSSSMLTNLPALPGKSLCPAQLTPAIQAILNRPIWQRSHWGVLIEQIGSSSDSLTVSFAHNAEQYFTPASNVKLLLTAAALHRLGADFRIPTVVYAVKAQPQQTVLMISGLGDPTLADKELEDLAQQLSQAGIRQVDQLIADDRAFQDSTLNETWAIEDLSAGSIVPISSLMVNRNVVPLRATSQKVGEPLQLNWLNAEDAGRWRVVNQTWTVAIDAPEFVHVQVSDNQLTLKAALAVGSEPETIDVPVPNPTRYFLERFQLALAQHQIQVIKTTTAQDVGRAEIAPTAIAKVESPPLRTLITEINQHSDNVEAEALLRVLGTQYKSEGQASETLTTAEKGVAAVQQALTEMGVDPQTYQLVDGSGLSRQNLVSPQAIAQTLSAIANSPNAEVFRNSLAKAGESGTLASRFAGTEAVGRVWGKTGTLTGIAALSGIIQSSNPQPHESPLVFSILVNQSEQPSAAIRQAIDEIVLLLVRLHHC